MKLIYYFLLLSLLAIWVSFFGECLCLSVLSFLVEPPWPWRLTWRRKHRLTCSPTSFEDAIATRMLDWEGSEAFHRGHCSRQRFFVPPRSEWKPQALEGLLTWRVRSEAEPLSWNFHWDSDQERMAEVRRRMSTRWRCLGTWRKCEILEKQGRAAWRDGQGLRSSELVGVTWEATVLEMWMVKDRLATTWSKWYESRNKDKERRMSRVYPECSSLRWGPRWPTMLLPWPHRSPCLCSHCFQSRALLLRHH